MTLYIQVLDRLTNFLSIMLDKKLHNRYIKFIEVYKPYNLQNEDVNAYHQR
jgi:hypothetical protein